MTLIAGNSKNFTIFDCRPKLNAQANKIKGAGFESEKHYPNIKNMNIEFCDMQNIHSVRNYYYELYEKLTYNQDDNKNFLLNFEKCNWYQSVLLLINSSIKIVKKIKDNNNVLIHCSDGWDRTTQLCCMSQIFLDKRYRTIDGFINLIEKDWISFGHQFSIRGGYYSKNKLKHEFSPIFIQFLDSLYQIMIQNICSFEYNINLLSFLAMESINGVYGTFMFGCDYIREKYSVKENTVSVWTYVKENISLFTNPLYEENNNKELIFSEKFVTLWKDFFLKYEKNYCNENEEYSKKFNKLKEENLMNLKIIEQLKNFITENKMDTGNLPDEARKVFLNKK